MTEGPDVDPVEAVPVITGAVARAVPGVISRLSEIPKVRACPFCGRVPSGPFLEDTEADYMFAGIYCKRCDCLMTETVADHGDIERAYRCLIGHWNHRAGVER